MFGFGPRETTTHTHRHTAHAHAHASDYPKQTRRANRIRGLKAAVNKPRTTDDGREGAQAKLVGMGVRPNKPTLGTRIRHMLHLPGKTHRRNAARPVRAY